LSARESKRGCEEEKEGGKEGREGLGSLKPAVKRERREGKGKRRAYLFRVGVGRRTARGMEEAEESKARKDAHLELS
jgi:hypothetical protein